MARRRPAWAAVAILTLALLLVASGAAGGAGRVQPGAPTAGQGVRSDGAAGPPSRLSPVSPSLKGRRDGAQPASTPIYSYRILHTYPHDPAAFTQGLVYTDGLLYESTGLYGRSSLRKVVLETGEVIQSIDLPDAYFGEGIAVYSDTVVQLTWREHIALVYDRETFAPTGVFTYSTEGWGLTHDGQRLIMSDGSSYLYFRDPWTFSETGRVQVHDGAMPVTRLNELEYIDGEVYANVWLTERIARIDPQTGQVTAWIDLAGLRPPGADVLNGIAYDAQAGRLFVTGKLWPYLYEIELYLPWRYYLPLFPKSGGGSPGPTPTPVPGPCFPPSPRPLVPGLLLQFLHPRELPVRRQVRKRLLVLGGDPALHHPRQQFAQAGAQHVALPTHAHRQQKARHFARPADDGKTVRSHGVETAPCAAHA